MCVLKPSILLSVLVFSLPKVQAQLQLFVVDSSYTTKDYGEVGASFTRKNGKQKLTENAGGVMLNGAIDYYCNLCAITSDGRFTFDRAKVLNNRSDIVIWAFKNGDKYSDTLRIRIPEPIAVSALKNKCSIAPRTPVSLDFQFLFDNGESVASTTHPHLLKTIRFRELPSGFGFEKGQLHYSATRYYDSCLLSYYVEGLPHVGGQICIYPQYNYTLNINGKGRNGQQGSSGRSGYSGSGSTPTGQNGQNGGNGDRGTDAQDMTMTLRTMPSGVVKIELERSRNQTEAYYVDFRNGGQLRVDLSGGDGGEGGDGGDGGSGMNATSTRSAGYGGTGGEGGYGGHGGRGGSLMLYTDSSAYRFIDKVYLNNKGGIGGSGGKGGKGGRGGSDTNAKLLDIIVTGRRGNIGNRGGAGNDGQNGFPITVRILP